MNTLASSTPTPILKVTQSPTILLIILGTSIRLIHISLLYILSKLIPPFDSSQSLLSPDNLPGLRWDAIHFASVAQNGYEFEQQLAFQPLLMGLLRLLGQSVVCIRGREMEVGDVIWSGVGISAVAWVGASIVLYKLTVHLYNPAFAILTTILYMIPPTPVPSLPYTEPLYAFTTFLGAYLVIVKRQYLLSGLIFACSTGLRATGIFNVLILGGVGSLEGLSVDRITLKVLFRRLLTQSYKLVIPCVLTVSPFLIFQRYAYQSFCHRDEEPRRPWCGSRLPFVYGFVQKEYWNIGFLNYWTIPNIPNILLPLPIFLTSVLGIKKIALSCHTAQRRHHARSEILILYIHHALMMLLLLFNSHTQILLRTCITDPVIWWNVAGLAVNWENKENASSQDRGKIIGKRGYIRLTRIGKYWIGWCVVWSTVSTILWVGHYPPA
ncbi:uncharacterized protein L199_000391 [Kwoniella botswanensis]|uniref:uncharacterized protein n=1 Tax=Kwoniella botswanensis TaxID=1268659 RepID=UPI00315CDC87